MKYFYTLLLCLLAAPTFATSYFIDYSNGVDTAVGTSTNTPWKHCPGDPLASNTVATAALSAGDTVYFKGGISYVLTAPYTNLSGGTPGILLKFSGGNGNPITYNNGATIGYGTGPCIFTDNAGTNQITVFGTPNGMTNLSFLNLSIGPMGGGVLPSDPDCTLYSPNGIPPNPGNGISCSGFASNIVLGSCTVSNMGYNGNGCPLGGGSFAGGGFHCNGCDGVTITNCNFTLMFDGPYFDNNSYSANVLISNNTFSFIARWVISPIEHTNCYLSNWNICYNLFTNTDQGIVGSAWTGYNANAYGHRDCIFIRGDEFGGGLYALDRNVADTNVNIFNNTFVDTLNYLGGSACIWVQECGSANIYNNVFNNLQHSSGFIDVSEPASNTVWHVGIYNNTIYANDFYTPISYGAAPNKNGINSYNWGVNVTNILVDSYNNLVILYAGGHENNSFCEQINCENTALATNVIIDYTIYRGFQSNFPGTNMVYGNWPATSTGAGFGYVELTTGPTIGWDVHSAVSDPMIVATNNLRLQSNSYALTAGRNLTALGIPFLNSDFDGNARVTSGSWPVGAFGAGILSLPPSAPMRCCR